MIGKRTKKTILMLMAGLSMAVFSGCGDDLPEYYESGEGGQSTVTGQPEYKDDPALMEIISSSKGDGKYSADANWQENISAGKINMVLDATVSVPDVDKYPVVKVQDSRITQEQADKVFEYLSQGNELLGSSGLEASDDGDDSDEDGESSGLDTTSLQQEIDKLKTVKEQVEQGNREIDGVTYDQSPEDLQMMIDSLQQQLDDIASGDIDAGGEPEASGSGDEGDGDGDADQPKTKFDDVGGENAELSQQLMAYVDLGRETRNMIIINNYSSNLYQHSQILFESADPANPSMLEEVASGEGAAMDSQPDGVEMTKDEAAAKAKEAAEGMGISGLEVASVRRGYGWMWEENKKEGWVVRLRRNVEGVQLAPLRNKSVLINVNRDNAATYGLEQMFETGENPQASAMESLQVRGFDYEEMLVCLDDSGITYLDYNGAITIGDTENDNVKLLPFEDLKQSVKDNAADTGVYENMEIAEDDTVENVTINIDNIQLGLLRIPLEGDPAGGRLIPVWTLSGTHTTVFNKEKKIAELTELAEEDDPETPEEQWEKYLSPEATASARKAYGVQMVVNALDGSIIPTVL